VLLIFWGFALIERIRGKSSYGRNQSSAYKDLIWIVSTANDESLDLVGQTTEALDALEEDLIKLGSDKTGIISAQIFIANINDKPKMDTVWNEWIGDDPECWPQRACLGVNLGGNWLIEITVTAARL